MGRDPSTPAAFVQDDGRRCADLMIVDDATLSLLMMPYRVAVRDRSGLESILRRGHPYQTKPMRKSNGGKY